MSAGMNPNSKYVIYSGSGEWSALYVDGQLVKSGDHYLVDEHIRYNILRAEVRDSDAFMGGTKRDVFKTLKEVEDYEAGEAALDFFQEEGTLYKVFVWEGGHRWVTALNLLELAKTDPTLRFGDSIITAAGEEVALPEGHLAQEGFKRLFGD